MIPEPEQRTSTRQQANKGAGTSTLRPGQHPMPSVCCPVCVAQCAACSSAPPQPAPSSVYSVPHPPSSSSTWPACPAQLPSSLGQRQHQRQRPERAHSLLAK
ncbi:uncharacterized protein TrAtP1_004431 [Trichoderma atroviride]|uniref:uncharacterized protein n=1 Tax=Hypocrea atroviridis TaxID=63577 RepID=UPI00332C3CFA|nr:hypothetical protein TrAtP1_004431 [Trichoderma atroviride]